MSTQALQWSAGSLVVLAVGFLGFVCLGLPDGMLGVAWPSLRDEQGRAQTDFGLILLVHGAAYFSSGLLAARLGHRFKPAALLMAASGIVASGLLSMAMAPSWWLVLAAIALIGAGSGMINTTVNTYASRHFSPRHVNWLHACYSLGAALGPLAMTVVVANQASWQWGYAWIAVAAVAMAGAYGWTARYWQPPIHELQHAASARAPRVSALLLRQTALFFCYSGLELTLGRWCYTVLTEWRGIAPEPAGVAASGFFGSIFVGRLLLGAALDRVDATRMVRIASAVAVVGSASFAFGEGSVAAIGLVLAGFALAPIFPTLVAQSASRFPSSQLARVITLCVAAAILGSAVIPYLAGVATRAFGLGTITITAVMLAVMLVVLHESIVRRPSRPTSLST